MNKIIYVFLNLSLSLTAFADSEGLTRLMQGNKRYINDTLQHPNRSSETRRANVSNQQPFAIIIGCSDSRVSPEIIFDQGIGDLFIVRVAGNVVGALELESILYSVLYLHSSVILVLGHENCGAISAVIEGNIKDIAAIAQLLQPAVQEEKKLKPPNLLSASVKKNAIRMRNYLQGHPTIQKLIQDKKLEAYAAYYHLDSGTVEILKEP